ncbi:MAG: pyridoxal-phosphate dependent enzyme [bacterium]
MDDHVVIDAAVAYGDLANVKMIPAFYMLAESKKKGLLDGIHTIAEPTSGNFGSSIGLLAPAFGIPNVVLYIKKDSPPGKTHVLEALPSTTVIKYPPGAGRPTGLELAKEFAKQPGVICLNQYGNRLNLESHFMYTGPAIWRATHQSVTVLVGATGSGGTLGGAGLYLKSRNKKIVTVRAVAAPGEEIPAGRTLKQMEEIVTIPYPENTFDFTLDCDKKSAYLNALALGEQIHSKPGPTSGETHKVTIKWIDGMKRVGNLDRYRNSSGNVHVVEIFADAIDLYAERITGGTNYTEDVH